MKRKLFLISTITMCFFALSCTKDISENISNTNKFGFNVYLSEDNSKTNEFGMNSWLVFPSVNDYEEAVSYLNKLQEEDNLNSFEEQLNYISTRVYYSEIERDSLQIFDDVLATLLNPDGVIQICDYIIAIDMIHGELHVQNAADSTIDFITSTDNDFIDYIEGKITFEELNKPEIMQKSVKHDDYNVVRTFMFAGSTSVNVTMKAWATNAGILSSIKSQIYIDQIFLGNNAPYISVETLSGGFYRLPNKKVTIPVETKSGKTKSYTITSYSGFQRIDIHYYRYNVKFKYGNSSSSIVDIISISLPYYT